MRDPDSPFPRKYFRSAWVQDSRRILAGSPAYLRQRSRCNRAPRSDRDGIRDHTMSSPPSCQSHTVSQHLCQKAELECQRDIRKILVEILHIKAYCSDEILGFSNSATTQHGLKQAHNVPVFTQSSTTFSATEKPGIPVW